MLLHSPSFLCQWFPCVCVFGTQKFYLLPSAAPTASHNVHIKSFKSNIHKQILPTNKKPSALGRYMQTRILVHSYHNNEKDTKITTSIVLGLNNKKPNRNTQKIDNKPQHNKFFIAFSTNSHSLSLFVYSPFNISLLMVLWVTYLPASHISFKSKTFSLSVLDFPPCLFWGNVFTNNTIRVIHWFYKCLHTDKELKETRNFYRLM